MGDIVDGLQTVGVVKTGITFYILLFLIVLGLIIGPYLYFSNPYTEDTTATVHNVTCNQYTSYVTSRDFFGRYVQQPVQRWNCGGQQTYTVNDKSFTVPYESSELTEPVKDGTYSSISYDPKDPSHTGFSKKTEGTIVIIYIIVMLILVLLAYVNYRASKESKVYGAAQGVMGTIDIFRNF